MHSQHSLEKNSHNRVFGLDLMRAIAIIIVVMGHGAFLLNNTQLSDFPYIPLPDGVDLFFVLSGFLIGGILLKDMNAADTFGVRELFAFWKRRWYRTLPNYYLILVLNYLIVNGNFIKEDISKCSWKFLFFLQNFNSPFYGFFWESWSLSVEEWFYIFSPIMLFVFLKILNAKNSFLLLCIIMILFSPLYRISIAGNSVDDFTYDIVFKKLVITRLDSIAYGLFAAWVFFYYRALWNKLKWICFVIGFVLTLFLLNYEAPNSTFFKQVFYLSLAPLAFMMLLPFLYDLKNINAWFSKSITHISKISYSMYLINLALVSEVIKDNFPPVNETDALLKYCLYWIIVISTSSVLYNYFEKPILRMRDTP